MQTTAMQRKQNSAFKLKGSLFTLTVLQLLDADISKIAAQLHATVKKLPSLFNQMPIVIDLSQVNQTKTKIDLEFIKYELQSHGIIPIGVRNADSKQIDAAKKANLAILSSNNPPNSNTDHALKPSKEQSDRIEFCQNKYIDKPVRSGQQIYAKNANLIVTHSVSAGAEVLADGWIHVYGSLRGRALAGINGDKTARIICRHLDAELISIAGFYRVQENLPHSPEAMLIQIYLEDEQLCVDRISN